jgi:hypothetical protein
MVELGRRSGKNSKSTAQFENIKREELGKVNDLARRPTLII